MIPDGFRLVAKREKKGVLRARFLRVRSTTLVKSRARKISVIK